jgi:hypothetical protein
VKGITTFLCEEPVSIDRLEMALNVSQQAIRLFFDFTLFQPEN